MKPVKAWAVLVENKLGKVLRRYPVFSSLVEARRWARKWTADSEHHRIVRVTLSEAKVKAKRKVATDEADNFSDEA